MHRNPIMAMSKPEEQQLKILGCTINFVKVGDGRMNLLFLPGWLGTWRSDFEALLIGFDHHEFTMVVWDPPGYGKSTIEGYRRCIPQECKLDAAKAHKLMKQLHLVPFSVLGWSEGGVTALHIAHKAPNTVSKVIIWGTPSYITREEVAFSERRSQLNVISPETKSRLITEYGEVELEKMLKRAVKLNHWVLNDYGGNLCREILPEITQPTLVLHGKQDWIVDKLHGEYITASISNARQKAFRCELHDTAQHALHIEEPVTSEANNLYVMHSLLPNLIKEIEDCIKEPIFELDVNIMTAFRMCDVAKQRCYYTYITADANAQLYRAFGILSAMYFDDSPPSPPPKKRSFIPLITKKGCLIKGRILRHGRLPPGTCS